MSRPRSAVPAPPTPRRLLAGVLAAGAVAVAGCGSAADETPPIVAQVPAQQPTAVATGTWGLFAAETTNGVITRRTPTGNVITSRRLGGRVTSLTAPGDHAVAVLGDTNEVVVMRSEDLSVEARTRAITGPPGAITAVAVDGELVIADDPGDRLVRMTLPSLRVVRSIPLPRGSSPMSLDADGTVYVTARNATPDGLPGVIRVAPDGDVRVRAVPSLTDSPCGIAVHDGRVLSVATRAGMGVLRPRTLQPLRDGTDADPVVGIAATFDDSALVVSPRGQVMAVSYDTGETIHTLGFVPRRVPCGAMLLGDVWLPDRENGALLRLTLG